MFTKKIVRHFGRSINYASFICAVPFYWDAKSHTLKVTKSKFKRLIVFCQLAALIVFIVAVLERLILIGSGFYMYEPLLLIIAGICLITMSMPIIFAAGFQLYADEVAQIVNLLMKFYKQIDCK
jgi:hypothetical protein